MSSAIYFPKVTTVVTRQFILFWMQYTRNFCTQILIRLVYTEIVFSKVQNWVANSFRQPTGSLVLLLLLLTHLLLLLFLLCFFFFVDFLYRRLSRPHSYSEIQSETLLYDTLIFICNEPKQCFQNIGITHCRIYFLISSSFKKRQ